MTIWVRQSGTEIELQDTQNFNELASANGWERKAADSGELDELKDMASELGIKFRADIGADKLKKKIEEALEAADNG